MAQHMQSPSSGNWENSGKTKRGDIMYPLNPQEDPNAGTEVLKVLDGVSDSPHHVQTRTDLEIPRSPAPLKLKHLRKVSREEGDYQRSTDSPLRHDNAGRRTPFESPLHRNAGLSGGDTPRRASRQGDRSLEVSPLHPHSHARLGAGKGSGVSSPTWERKGSSEGGRGIAPSTPSRSRLRSATKGDDTPDHSPVVPKFGDWDDTDPSSAEQFTQVFDRVRDEKQSEAGKVPVMPTETPDPNSEKQYRNENAKGCSCFPWLGK